jgi:DNA-binding beta-propeller fold protein YncE
VAAWLFAARARSEQLLVVDDDAHLVRPDTGGALFVVDPRAPVDRAPAVLAAADAGAPFELTTGIAVSPLTGDVFVADWGMDAPAVVHAVDCATGTVTTALRDPGLERPLGMDLLPDGRLVVADWDADPLGLGPDGAGGLGHGAIFVTDPSCTAPPCGVTVLSDGSRHPFGAGVATAFSDPVDVAVDAAAGRVYVADRTATTPAGAGPTSLFAVDLASGAVSLVASRAEWTGLMAVALRPDGRPVVIDADAFDWSSAWLVDPAVADPAASASLLSRDPQLVDVWDLAVGAQGEMYLLDAGAYDRASGTFFVRPAAWRLDPLVADPTRNAVLVSRTTELARPVAAATTSGCPALVEATVARTSAAVTALRQPPCDRTPWGWCPAVLRSRGPLGTFTIPGAIGALPGDTVTFYEHGADVADLVVRRSGPTDLVVSRP